MKGQEMRGKPEDDTRFSWRLRLTPWMVSLALGAAFLPDIRWRACECLGLDPEGDMIYEVYDPCPQPDFSAYSPNERTIGNTVGMQLVLIPSGSYIMGSPSTEPFHEPDERPHLVHLSKPFYLSAHEVTVGQFQRFVEETGYVTESETNPRAALDLALAGWSECPELSWRNPGFVQSENEPVVQVTWADAVAFCRWLSQKEGCTYRLPTEAEWECACRAGNCRPYASVQGQHPRLGMNIYDVRTSLHESNPSIDDGHRWTAPVGSFPANSLGLHDMHGNVSEWCSDWYGADYYSSSPSDDPEGPAAGRQRVIRGGGWLDTLHRVRSANRWGHEPEMCSGYLGFRVARTYR